MPGRFHITLVGVRLDHKTRSSCSYHPLHETKMGVLMDDDR